MNLFQELKRRNVFKVAVAYIIVSWLILQVIGSIVPIIEAPEWVSKAILIFLLAGFPIALLFAWAFELTPEGIKKESEVVRDESITGQTSSKINLIIIGSLILIIGGFVYDKFFGASITIESEQNEVIASEATVKETPIEILYESNKLNDKSIAVLPFTNMAANEKNESFTLGIHDDLLTHLSKISALKVISRTSVLRYKSTEKPIAEIAKELGVQNILEGSVQSSGQQIRINVQLIDAKTDEHLWAEIYDRKLTTENIFNIQTEISTKIAAALKAQLSPEEKNSLEKKATNNIEAYNAYITGRQHMISRTSADLKQALAFFERAAELDPNYALAYVGQADTLNLLSEYSDLSKKEVEVRGDPLIAKALQIEPLLAEAHTSKANYLMYKGQTLEAEKSFKYSLTLNPNYATTYHWYGLLLRDLGHYQQFLDIELKAAALDPLSPAIQVNVAWALELLGQNKEALTQYHRIIGFSPKYPGAYFGIAGLKYQHNNLVEAVYWINKAVSLDKGNASFGLFQGIIYVELDDLMMANMVLSEMTKDFPNNFNTIILQTLIYIANGELDEAYKLTTKIHQLQPENTQQKLFLALTANLVGNYKQASILLLDVYANKISGSISVDEENFDDMLTLAGSYKMLDQKNEYQSLLIQLKQSLSTMSKSEIKWRKILIESLQEHNKAAAESYFQMIDNKEFGQWWINEKLITAEVKNQPQYIKANQKLKGILKQQREILANPESTEKTE